MNFYKQIKDWLLPKGYVECYKNFQGTEYHFIKDGVRVVCVDDFSQHCYLSISILSEVASMDLKTQKYPIGFNDLDTISNHLINKKNIGDDIRNKLSPLKNMILLLEKGHYDLVQNEIKQCKENIDYLTNL